MTRSRRPRLLGLLKLPIHKEWYIMVWLSQWELIQSNLIKHQKKYICTTVSSCGSCVGSEASGVGLWTPFNTQREMMILLLIGLLIGPCLTTCAFPGTLSSACSALNGMTVTSRCDSSSSYRTSTGQCNNLQAPYLGAAITPFRRLIKSNYDDKISTPRQFKVQFLNIGLVYLIKNG